MFMSQPMRNEFDYYSRIMDQFCKKDRLERNLDIFVSQEIIHILKLPVTKTPQEKQVMSNIVKNSIILLLALYKRDNSEGFRNFNEFDEPQQKIIQKELLTLISV